MTPDELAGFVRQSMSLDLSEFLEVPPVLEPEPTKRSSSSRKKHPTPSPEQTLSELLAITHSENITDWMKVIARFMAVRRKATLAELVIELKMPWVEVWMGLLMDGQYQLTRSESEEEAIVRADQLKKTKRDFVELLPDLTVEVKSKSDRIKPLVEKIELFLKLGTQVGILIDPDQFTLTVYRLNQPAVVLKDGDTLTIPELLPGWELAVSELWPPEFD